MTIFENPRDAALELQRNPILWAGSDERATGYGVMGLPFASGHYLALRNMAATTIGPGYRSVWHRMPNGQWTFISDAAPEQSCARYFASDSAQTLNTEIEIHWDGPTSFRVSVPGLLEWRLELAGTPATLLMSALGRRLPAAAGRGESLRRMMARTAGPMLGAGRMGMAGTAPNGQRFAAAPWMIWTVSRSTATLRGADLGSPLPLLRQAQLGDFWLPQRGLFALANVAFENFDPARHHPVHYGSEMNSVVGQQDG
ncbi:hypothetical protein [Mycolicibacterium hodleri]|uniref:Uncharacterized protein n=1 Tax=Mycolicibacterium hodleri TaxID=49897 RepID=A0A502DZ71_9MYCO|nr:hypothetical protein [Mycolicibacterium hodleri]TPG29581.1 hypothetical protein EAH80_26545 [Mycolicibacterium hodleri]